MSPVQRRRAVCALFIVGGALYAYSNLDGAGSGGVRAFGVAVGVLVALYGVWQLRQVPREYDRDGPGGPRDGTGPPPA